jgi:hypothetical protein
MTEPTRWSGTGHRIATRKNPDGLTDPQLRWVREQLRTGLHRLSQQGPIVVLTGMALGFDMELGAAGFDLGIPFEAHIPYESQPMLWPPAAQAEWLRLRSVATREVVYGNNPGNRWTAVKLLHARNDGLLEADRLLGCWDARKRKGGTWSAIEKAQRLGLAGIHLDPATRTVRRVEPGDWFEKVGPPPTCEVSPPLLCDMPTARAGRRS